MSDEITDEIAEGLAQLFARRLPAGPLEVTPLGALYLAVLEFRDHNPDGYDQALVAVRAAFYEADDE